jgi:hypothetical protein
MPTWIAAAIAVVILGGGGWYAASHVHRSAPVTDAAPAAEAEGSFTGSLRALVARGGNYACTMHTDSGNTPTDGTIYVSGEHIRGDFTSTVPQIGNVDTHMIADGDTLYLWNSLMPKGIKSSEVAETDGSDSDGVNMDQSYTYDCKAWVADESKFVVPTDITFTAPSA